MGVGLHDSYRKRSHRGLIQRKHSFKLTYTYMLYKQGSYNLCWRWSTLIHKRSLVKCIDLSVAWVSSGRSSLCNYYYSNRVRRFLALVTLHSLFVLTKVKRKYDSFIMWTSSLKDTNEWCERCIYTRYIFYKCWIKRETLHQGITSCTLSRLHGSLL